ncbi:MAG: glycoside hydrolase 43 family protein [Treponema sp.]|nr:glycoside hydrolase 43 family protein [Treponema sp.]
MKKIFSLLFLGLFGGIFVSAQSEKALEVSGVYKTASANIIVSDYPDLDVIRVDDTYYMVSTTMHFMPGCVILRSYNLLDWEFCSYVYEELEKTPGQELLDGKGIYGKGMWAASLRYHKGLFYVSFVANDTGKTYLYTSENIQGPWKKSTIRGFYHDLSILFDDDGRVFITHGNCDLHLTQMNEDLSGPKTGGIDKVIVRDEREKVWLGYEGSHFYKINGKYYLFLIDMPKGKMRTESCFIADKVDGPYQKVEVFHSDLGGWNSGLAQGGIVQANDGKWYGILFQDHGALGRIPVLIPVNFDGDRPVFGLDGKAPQQVKVLDNRPEYKYKPLYTSAFCDSDGKLNPLWQWNHIHNPQLASVKNEVLSIKTDRIVSNVVQAPNSLTQRTVTEKCFGSVEVDASNINEGDYAGLCALEGEYAFIAVTKRAGKYYLTSAEHKITQTNPDPAELPNFLEEIEIPTPKIRLALKFNLSYRQENVQLMYFDQSKSEFVRLGNRSSKLRYTLDQFVGVRFALFNYSTKTAGRSASFKDFEYEFW